MQLRWLIPTLLLSATPCLGQGAPPVAENTDEKGDAELSATQAPSEAEFWRALKLLESKVPAELAEGRIALQLAADHESTHAQVLLGNCFLSGSYGFGKEPKKAVNLFRLAAERNNAFAKVSLGTCYATGAGVRKDDTKAAEWLTAAVAENADYSRPQPPPDYFTGANRTTSGVAGEINGDPVASSRASAHFLLAQIAARKNQMADAQTHYVAAAFAGPGGASGIYQAALEAAINYALGKGVPRDATKATELLDQSRRLTARMGVNLIHNYVNLKIVDEFAVADLEESITEAGSTYQSAVQFALGEVLANKKSKEYNPQEAARWYELAAESGQAWAMLSLAAMYTKGELGAPDPSKAYLWYEKAGGGDKPKHLLGVANMAICLLHGIGTPKDEARAKALFTKYRNRDIVCYLGSIGAAPTQVLTYEGAQTLNQTWAREKNDPTAQYLWAVRYLNGDGVKADHAEAGRWLKKAAKANQPDALVQLGWLYEYYPSQFGISNREKAARAAFECYETAGRLGNIEGLANYAALLRAGVGTPADEVKAIQTYERCLQLDPNHSRTHNNLGHIYQAKLEAQTVAGSDADSLRKAMMTHYEASAAQEVPLSAMSLGDLYREGKLVPQDWSRAYSYYDKAAEVPAHRAIAHYQLGLMHEFGRGVPVTPTEAAYHFRLAALEGHVMALRHLVNFYLTGTGVSLDFDRAGYWLDQMIAMGQADGFTMMADVLLKKQDFAKAVKLLEVMTRFNNQAISGHAHERLSLCYASGSGVAKNPKRAEKHFKIALEKGNGAALKTLAYRQIEGGRTTEGIATLTRAAESEPSAAYNLGQLYYFGTYVTVDREKALRYLRDAANTSNADAPLFLASLTWNNDPGAPSLAEAINYAQKAENLGNPKAAAVREKLEKRQQSTLAKPEENASKRST